MHPSRDESVISRGYSRGGLISRTLISAIIVMTILLSVGVLTSEDGSNNLIFVITFYILTAAVTGLAVWRGWLTGSRSYQGMYGTYRNPVKPGREVFWQSCIIFGCVTLLTGMLLATSDNGWINLFIVFLDVNGCIGFGLYFGERMGWGDA